MNKVHYTAESSETDLVCSVMCGRFCGLEGNFNINELLEQCDLTEVSCYGVCPSVTPDVTSNVNNVWESVWGWYENRKPRVKTFVNALLQIGLYYGLGKVAKTVNAKVVWAVWVMAEVVKFEYVTITGDMSATEYKCDLSLWGMGNTVGCGTKILYISKSIMFKEWLGTELSNAMCRGDGFWRIICQMVVAAETQLIVEHYSALAMNITNNALGMANGTYFDDRIHGVKYRSFASFLEPLVKWLGMKHGAGDVSRLGKDMVKSAIEASSGGDSAPLYNFTAEMLWITFSAGVHWFCKGHLGLCASVAVGVEVLAVIFDFKVNRIVDNVLKCGALAALPGMHISYGCHNVNNMPSTVFDTHGSTNSSGLVGVGNKSGISVDSNVENHGVQNVLSHTGETSVKTMSPQDSGCDVLGDVDHFIDMDSCVDCCSASYNATNSSALVDAH